MKCIFNMYVSCRFSVKYKTISFTLKKIKSRNFWYKFLLDFLYYIEKEFVG